MIDIVKTIISTEVIVDLLWLLYEVVCPLWQISRIIVITTVIVYVHC